MSSAERPGGASGLATAAPKGAGKKTMFKHILVPLDGSPLAEAILPTVMELAKIHGARVTLLRVAFAHVFLGVDPTESQVRVVQEAEIYLSERQRELEAEGVRTSGSVRYGSAPEEIVAHAAERGVDLIAMSTHGRSGPTRWILGSVAEQVVRHAPVAVLLVRAGQPVARRRGEKE